MNNQRKCVIYNLQITSTMFINKSSTNFNYKLQFYTSIPLHFLLFILYNFILFYFCRVVQPIHKSLEKNNSPLNVQI